MFSVRMSSGGVAVRRIGVSRHPALVLGILAIAGIVFALFAAWMWQQQARFNAEGVSRQGQVIDTDIRLGNRSRTTGNRNDDYLVLYSYSVGDQTYQTRQNVSRAEYASFNPGDSIEVIYLPSEPGTSILATQSSSVLPAAMLAGAAIFNIVVWLAGFVLLVRPWLAARHQPALA